MCKNKGKGKIGNTRFVDNEQISRNASIREVRNHKPSCRKLREMNKDEIAGSKEYHKYKFHEMADDEERHSRVLKRKLGKCPQ